VATPPQPGRPWKAALRGNVLMMGLVSLFTDFSSEMMNPLLPVFIAGLVPLSLAPVYVGLMEGVAETAASLLKIFSGRLSDALGRRKAIVVIGYALSTVFRPAMALAGAGWHMVAFKFADRVGKGLRTSPRDALISDAVPASVRGLAFSFHRTMDHAGAILGPIAAIILLYAMLGRQVFSGVGLWQHTGPAVSGQTMPALRWLFALAIIPGAAAMYMLLAKVREIAPPAERGPGERFRLIPRGLPRKFYLYVGIVTVFALGNSSDLFLVFYGLQKFNLDLAQLVGLWIALHASKVVFSFPGGALSDRLGRRPLILAGWFIYALVYLGMARAGAVWQFWTLIVIYGVYYGLTEGAEKALVADFVGSQHRGTAFGLYHMAVGIASLPASLLFGVFWNQIGPRWAFGIGAAMAGLAAVLLAVLLSTTHQGLPQER
jgi:MFS family permease